MNNTLSTQIQTIVNKLPVTIFFEEIKDRKQTLKYVQWLYDNVPESKTIMPQDQFFREVISKELRLVSMKIIEIEILLMVGLETITLNDFSIDGKTLVNKLISENPDNYELDIMYRIIAQIMTKLPKDLKERVTGKQKLQLFQKISQSINIDNKLLEEFASVDPSLSLNTPVSMELDEGDYDTLNKKYLFELKNYEASKGYVTAESMEYADIARKNLSSNPKVTNNNLKAQYIDNNPDFMLGQNDNTLYYFDSSSGVLTEMPLNSNQKPVSLKDLKTILTSDKVKKNEIQGLINGLQPQTTNANTNAITSINTIPTPSILSSDPTMPIQPKSFFEIIGSYFTSGSSVQATGTSSPTTSIPLSTVVAPPCITVQSNDDNSVNSTKLPIPPQYIINTVKENNIRYGRGGSGERSPMSYMNSEQRDDKEDNYYEKDDKDSNMSYMYKMADRSNEEGPIPILSRDITTYRNNYTKINADTKRIIERQVIPDSNYEYDTNYKYANNNNNLEKRFKSREATYKPFFKQYSSSKGKSFMNRTNANDILPNQPKPEPFTNMNEEIFLTKIKNDNKKIENVALSFVVILILVFLLVIFNSIRNKK